MAAIEKAEEEAKKLRSLQKQLEQGIEKREKLYTQLNENETVMKEFELLEKDAEVFRLVGPYLQKQPTEEARSTVSKRVDFINSEIQKNEDSMKTLQQQVNAQREVLLTISKEAQRKQQQQQH